MRYLYPGGVWERGTSAFTQAYDCATLVRSSRTWTSVRVLQVGMQW